MALQITVDQGSLVTGLEDLLIEAFLSGVEDTNLSAILNALPLYSILPAEPQLKIRNAVKSICATFIKSINLKRAMPVGLSTTVTLARLTALGTEGSLTFTDGILTSKVDPT